MIAEFTGKYDTAAILAAPDPMLRTIDVLDSIRDVLDQLQSSTVNGSAVALGYLQNEVKAKQLRSASRYALECPGPMF